MYTMKTKIENNSEDDRIKVVITDDPAFRRIPISGVFGTLNPLEGRMGFFLDSVVPGLIDEYSTRMKPKELERRMMTEVRMSPETFIEISEWMNKRVAELRENMPETLQREED